MTDKISRAARSQNMRQIKNKDMKPELIVRRLVHGLGYRYRLHRRDLPGKPDLVFAGRKKVIFVHGCFWHQHGDGNCKIARLPKSNLDYWLPKLSRNVERDREQQCQLELCGWEHLVLWECQLSDSTKLKERITNYLCQFHLCTCAIYQFKIILVNFPAS
jgi:DNA mismatch endonuclease, patch repair protein